MTYTQYDEAAHLLETLVWTLDVITASEGSGRERISHSYSEARAFAASIPLAGTDARPRIKACLKKFNILKAAGDLAATGWMLAALEERISEGNLPDWEELRKVADNAVGLLAGSKLYLQ